MSDAPKSELIPTAPAHPSDPSRLPHAKENPLRRKVTVSSFEPRPDQARLHRHTRRESEYGRLHLLPSPATQSAQKPHLAQRPHTCRSANPEPGHSPQSRCRSGPATPRTTWEPHPQKALCRKLKLHPPSASPDSPPQT